MGAKIRGHVTIRIAAVFFVLSALLELVSVTADAPLFGGIRSGAAALLYHLAYAAIFFAIGLGLWRAKRWGYWAVMVGTALYTLDKAQFLLARETFAEYVNRQFAANPEVFAVMPKEEILQAIAAIHLVIILCWWGFAFYIHRRRAYFSPGAGWSIET